VVGKRTGEKDGIAVVGVTVGDSVGWLVGDGVTGWLLVGGCNFENRLDEGDISLNNSNAIVVDLQQTEESLVTV
jgi:hypothetical protein